MARSKSPVNRMMDAIVPKAVGALDPDELIERVDMNRLLERVDLDAVLDRIDIDALLARIDIDSLVGRIDLDSLVAQIDLDTLVGRIDLDALVATIDLEALIGRIDVNQMLSSVDVNELVGRIDLNAVIEQVDLNPVIERVDLNPVLADIDIAALMARAGIDKIVSEASTGLATRVLDTARGQIAGLDVVVIGLIDRLLRRGARASLDRPAIPSAPVGLSDSTVGDPAMGDPEIQSARQIRRAGPLARLLGFMVDSFIVSGVFGVAVNLTGSLIGLFTGREVGLANTGGPGWLVAFGLWWFLYLWLTVAISGRTFGKGLLGIRVLALDGSPLGPGSAAVRAIAFPFSFVLGLGFVPMVFGRAGRAMHDYAARSVEIVDWGPREVVLPAALDRWVDRAA